MYHGLHKIIQEDLRSIYSDTGSFLEQLRKKRILITGATGFIGKWLLNSLFYANDKENLEISITIITRNSNRFKLSCPDFFSRNDFFCIEADVVDLDFSLFKGMSYDYIIHAATDASADLNERNPKKMFDTIVSGTKNILDLSLICNAGRLLFLSSGAVYGHQPDSIEYAEESWEGSLDCTNPKNTYAEAKRAAEMMCMIYKKQFGLQISIARIFALLGPYLPLDTHFAAGNFINCAIKGEIITIKGNGLPVRSYLYISDLIVWLLHVLVLGESGSVYNLGSEYAISIKDLAHKISDTLDGKGVIVLEKNDQGWNLGRYVPSNKKIRTSLSVKQRVTLEQAIYRTAVYNKDLL
jgi:dTDP-glucose 4,6-dehydratase